MVCHCRYWTLRNNSSNISSVLHSKPFYRKTKHDCYQQQEQSQPSKSSFSHNSCYCHLKGVKPKLFTKPKHCPCETRIKAPPPIKVRHPSSDCVCHKRLTYRKSNFFDPERAKTLRDGAEEQLVGRFKTLNIENGDERGNFNEERDNFASSGYGGEESEGSYRNSKEKKRYKTALGRKSGNFSEKVENFASGGYAGEDTEGYYDDSKEKHENAAGFNRKSRDSQFNSRKQSENRELTENQREHYKTNLQTNKTNKYRTFSEDFVENNRLPTSSRLPADVNSSRAVPKVPTTTSKFHPNTNNSAESRLRAPNDRITSKHQDPADLKQITDFRKDHYFETHSTEDLTRHAIPPHKCVHSFALDGRFLPKALNCDEYGQSRCLICARMMDNPTLTETKKSSSHFPEYYKHGLAPRKVFIGHGDYNIEINLDSAQKVALNKSRPNYFNTLALKYQKGVQI